MNTDDPLEAPPESRTERHLRLLQELAEIGMDIARAVRAEALAVADDDAAAPAPSRFGRSDPGLVFSRIARAVRQTLALEEQIAAGRDKARDEHDRGRRNVEQLIFEQRQEDIREFVARAVEADAAERKLPDEAVERLLDDLDERLEDGAYDDALADGPIAELVERICRDLGIVPDWRIWDDQDWAVEYLRERTPTDVGAERWRHLETADPPPPDANGLTPDSS